MHSSELNICAPKPRERVPRLDPVPVGFNASLVREGGGKQYSRVGRSIKESGQMPAFSFCFSMGSVPRFVGMGAEATYRGDGVEGGEVFRVEGEGEDVGVLDYAGGRGGFGQGKDAVF